MSYSRSLGGGLSPSERNQGFGRSMGANCLDKLGVLNGVTRRRGGTSTGGFLPIDMRLLTLFGADGRHVGGDERARVGLWSAENNGGTLESLRSPGRSTRVSASCPSGASMRTRIRLAHSLIGLPVPRRLGNKAFSCDSREENE